LRWSSVHDELHINSPAHDDDDAETDHDGHRRGNHGMPPVIIKLNLCMVEWNGEASVIPATKPTWTKAISVSKVIFFAKFFIINAALNFSWKINKYQISSLYIIIDLWNLIMVWKVFEYVFLLIRNQSCNGNGGSPCSRVISKCVRGSVYINTAVDLENGEIKQKNVQRKVYFDEQNGYLFF